MSSEQHTTLKVGTRAGEVSMRQLAGVTCLAKVVELGVRCVKPSQYLGDTCLLACLS